MRLILFVLIIFYDVIVAISILALSFASDDLKNFSPHTIFQVSISIPFIIGVIFAFLARILFVIMIKLQQADNAPTTTTFLISMSSAVFVVISLVIFRSEEINISQIIGGLLVLIGVLILETPSFK